MKHNSYFPATLVWRRIVPALFIILTMAISSFSYGQDYHRRGPLITTNPVPRYPTEEPKYTPPAQGIQNPTQIKQPAAQQQIFATPVQTPVQTYPYGTQPAGSTGAVIPQNPFSGGAPVNPFQPTQTGAFGVNSAPVQQPTIQRNPFQIQQTQSRPVQAATIGGQVSAQPIQRPFDNQLPQSPYSPYMYLFAGRTGIGAGGDNYNLYVRPALEQQDYNRKMGEQVESLQQTILRQQQQIQQQNRTLNQLQQEGIIPTQPNQTIDTNPNSAQQYFNQQYQQYFNQQNR